GEELAGQRHRAGRGDRLVGDEAAHRRGDGDGRRHARRRVAGDLAGDVAVAGGRIGDGVAAGFADHVVERVLDVEVAAEFDGADNAGQDGDRGDGELDGRHAAFLAAKRAHEAP